METCRERLINFFKESPSPTSIGSLTQILLDAPGVIRHNIDALVKSGFLCRRKVTLQRRFGTGKAGRGYLYWRKKDDKFDALIDDAMTKGLYLG